LEIEEFYKKQEFLIDKWCSRTLLEPLRHLLNGQAALNGLTDGWSEMLYELKTIRAQNKDLLSNDEFEVLVNLIHAAEAAIDI